MTEHQMDDCEGSSSFDAVYDVSRIFYLLSLWVKSSVFIRKLPIPNLLWPCCSCCTKWSKITNYYIK